MNGLWIGVHRDPTLLVNALRGMRRQVDINTEVRVDRCRILRNGAFTTSHSSLACGMLTLVRSSSASHPAIPLLPHHLWHPDDCASLRRPALWNGGDH